MSHFYERTQEGVAPRHFVPLVKRPDDLRPTRITDVRKWWKEGRIVVPSVTTVLNVLNKAALNNWKIDQHLVQAHELNPADFVSREAYIAEVKRLTELQMDKAPTAGSDVHASLEAFMKGEAPAPEHETICENVSRALRDHCGQQEWHMEVRFTSDMGYGGCTDLVCGDWVIDYKSKQFASKFKPGKMAYPDHSMQLAAYRAGLGTECSRHARAANIFVCLETGDVDFHEHTEDQIQHGLKMFVAALEIWQLQNGNPMREASNGSQG